MPAQDLISQFFRIGTAGPTIDGREIPADMITEMAESYDPAEYTALINSEHFTGASPYGEFPSLGEVVALKADTDDKGRAVLLAQVKPTVALLNINARGQKLFPSMEITANFAGTDNAYLSGLAMTDMPASLGTQAIQYSATHGGPVPEKLKTHLYSQQFETDPFTMADADTKTDTNAPKPEDNGSGDEQTFLQKFTAIFAPKQAESSDKFAALETAALSMAEKVQEMEDRFAALPDIPALEATVKAQADEIKTLSAAMANTPNGATPRPEASGDDAVLTDC